MTNAEHLIENAIYALKCGESFSDAMNRWHNKMMLEETGIDANDLFLMAVHVVYCLYDGRFPGQCCYECQYMVEDKIIGAKFCTNSDAKENYVEDNHFCRLFIERIE